MRCGGLLVALLAALAALPAAASADMDVSRAGGVVTVAPADDRVSEVNHVEVVTDADGTLRIVEHTPAILLNGPGCSPDGNDVVCGPAAKVTVVAVRLGLGDDRLGRRSGTPVSPNATAVPLTADGGDGGDAIAGGGGDDRLRGGPGSDDLQGGDGRDLADFGDATVPVVATLPATGPGAAEIAGRGRDALRTVEDLAGGLGDDVLRGASGPNRISGGPGDDELDGLAGADVLDGDAGRDEIVGGDGADRLRGGGGDDDLAGRDGAADLELDCGAGDDDLVGDTALDAPTGCEVLAPERAGPPALSGPLVENQVLSSTEGTFSGGPLTFTRRWLRCDPDGTGCVVPAGLSTAPTYTLRRGDVGKVMKLIVRAENRAGFADSEAVLSGVVAAAVPPPAQVFAATFDDDRAARVLRTSGRIALTTGQRVQCRRGGPGCAVTVVATAPAAPARRGARLRPGSSRVTLGTSTATIASGATARVTVTLTRRGLAVLRRVRRPKVTFFIVVRQAGTTDAVKTSSARVRAPRRR